MAELKTPLRTAAREKSRLRQISAKTRGVRGDGRTDRQGLRDNIAKRVKRAAIAPRNTTKAWSGGPQGAAPWSGAGNFDTREVRRKETPGGHACRLVRGRPKAKGSNVDGPGSNAKSGIRTLATASTTFQANDRQIRGPGKKVGLLNGAGNSARKTTVPLTRQPEGLAGRGHRFSGLRTDARGV